MEVLLEQVADYPYAISDGVTAGLLSKYGEYGIFKDCTTCSCVLVVVDHFTYLNTDSEVLFRYVGRPSNPGEPRVCL